MAPPDDIKTETPASEGVGTEDTGNPAPAPKPRLREVKPESEVRGGSEAADDEL
jgi:hypothetical protein